MLTNDSAFCVEQNIHSGQLGTKIKEKPPMFYFILVYVFGAERIEIN